MGLVDQIASVLDAVGAGEPDSMQVMSCSQLAGQRYPHVDPSAALMILNVKDRECASIVSDRLSRAYPGNHELMAVATGPRHATVAPRTQ